MANTLLTGQLLCDEFVRCLDAALKLRDMQGRKMVGADDGYSYSYAWKLGDTVKLRVLEPLRPLGCAGMIERLVPVNLVHQPFLAFTNDHLDLTMAIDQFSQLVMRPQVYHLSSEVFKLWLPGETIVVAPLPVLRMADKCWRQITDSRLSIRYIIAYVAVNDTFVSRVEMLFGVTGNHVAAYQHSPAELEMIALLLEAKAHYQLQLQELRLAA